MANAEKEPFEINQALQILIASQSDGIDYTTTSKAFSDLESRLDKNNPLTSKDAEDVYNIVSSILKKLGRSEHSTSYKFEPYCKFLYLLLLRDEVPNEAGNDQMSKKAILELLLAYGTKSEKALEYLGRATGKGPEMSSMAMPNIMAVVRSKNGYDSKGVLSLLTHAIGSASFSEKQILDVISYCQSIISNRNNSYDLRGSYIQLLTDLASRKDIGYEPVSTILVKVFHKALENETKHSSDKPSSEKYYDRPEKQKFREAFKHAGITILESREDLPQLRTDVMKMYLGFLKERNWLLQGEAVYFLGKALRRMSGLREEFEKIVSDNFQFLEGQYGGKKTVPAEFIKYALHVQNLKMSSEMGSTWLAHRSKIPALGTTPAAGTPTPGTPLKQR